ncbi:unnamed protein product, partial [Meganyctiphanes norvegica]
EIPSLNFSNHALAFRHKTTHELLRGLIVLQTCSIDAIVNRSYKMLKVGERLLGERLLGVVTAPFYNQFVGRDSEQEMAVTYHAMAELGIGLMIAPMVESDVGEGENLHELFLKNFRKTLSLVSIVSRNDGLSSIPGICQTKFTEHLSAEVLMRLHEAYERLSFDERAQVVESVASAFAIKDITDCEPNFGPLQLDPRDMKEFAESLPRLYTIGRACVDENIVLAVDAEYTYIKTAINFISLAMMKVFNTDKTVVWNTYQGYLKNTKDILQHDLGIASELGFKFGAKIVRGAYLEMERERALTCGYPDPVNDTYQDTNNNYNSIIEMMLKEVKGNPNGRTVIVASHNEESVKKAAHHIHKLGLDPLRGNVVFGQVYGMAENISVPLAKSGYLVFKSVPSGSVLECLPYLSRRANENRAVFKGARRERQLLAQELRSRLAIV